MISNFCRSQILLPRPCVSGVILSLFLLTPLAVFAHAGHGDEFKGGSETSQTSAPIQVDSDTAKRLGIKVEPVKRQRLAIGIKTTGQIETLPNQKVEVTAPISGKIVELLVEPGAAVKVGQAVAVVSAPDLVELRVNSQEKRAEGEAFLQQSQADLKLAQESLERQQQIATAEIEQASTEVKVAQEKYDRDRDLANAGALPQRQMLESQAHLAEGKGQLTKASSRREVLEAQAQLKRAQAAVEVAQSRIRLSSTVYQTRLSQLGTRANEQGLVTVTAPISGTVADREVTVGQSFQDIGGKLMTIVNDNRVFATANIYEKDLNQVQIGQKVNVKIANLPGRTFAGKIATIGSAVAGETRVVPVKAELDNTDGLLKPGMFAQIEVLTEQTNTASLVVKSSAVVEANGKKLVYIQNGNAYQAAEVILGQTSGDLVEVKSGLFEGDLVVIERANQLYAQSLRGGSKTLEAHNEPSATAKAMDFSLPLWVIISGVGGVIGTTSSAAFWLGRRSKNQLVPASTGRSHLSNDSDYPVFSDEENSLNKSPIKINNHNQEKDISRQK